MGYYRVIRQSGNFARGKVSAISEMTTSRQRFELRTSLCKMAMGASRIFILRETFNAFLTLLTRQVHVHRMRDIYGTL